MSSRLMSAEKGRGKHAEQAGECGRVSALAGSLRAAYGRTDGVCALAGSLHAACGRTDGVCALAGSLRAACGRTDGVCALAGSTSEAYGRTDGVCALAGSLHADYGHGGFKLRWRGRNCRLRLRSGLRILAAHGNVGAAPQTLPGAPPRTPQGA